MSEYGFDYNIYGFEDTIALTEGKSIKRNKLGNANKRALVLASVASMIDQFNIPNIEILQKLGFTVDVAADFKNPGTITRKRAVELKKKLKGMGVKVIQIGIPRSINPGPLLNAYRELKELARNEEYSVVHCQSPIGGALCRLAFNNEKRKKTRSTSPKMIYMAHGFHFFKGAPKKNWLIFYPIEKILSRHTDVLITINHEDYYRAKKKFYAGKTFYVPGIGVDLEKFANINDEKSHIQKRKEIGVPAEAKMVMSVGELSDRKNHKIVIEALNHINDPEIYYVIVGIGDKKNELKESDKTGRVIFLGYRNDIPELLKCADLFVLPSLQEGLPVALMEAMAAEVATVCSDIRGNQDLIEKSARFRLGDISDIETKILTYLDKDIAGKQIARNSKIINRFSLTSVNKSMEHIYREL